MKIRGDASYSYPYGSDLNEGKAVSTAALSTQGVDDCPCLPASPGLHFAPLQQSICPLPPSIHKHTVLLALNYRHAADGLHSLIITWEEC